MFLTSNCFSSLWKDFSFFFNLIIKNGYNIVVVYFLLLLIYTQYYIITVTLNVSHYLLHSSNILNNLNLLKLNYIII